MYSHLLPVLLLLTLQLHADVIRLKNGSSFEGTVFDQGDKYEVKMDVGSMWFDKTDVAAVELSPERAAAARAAAEAREFTERRAALRPDDVVARLELAKWCGERQRRNDARALYLEALSIDPQCADAHVNLGHIRFRERWFADAQVAINDELPKAEDLATLHALLALCDENHLAPPKSLIDRIFALAPDDTELHLRLGHLRIHGSWYPDVRGAIEAELPKAENLNALRELVAFCDQQHASAPSPLLERILEFSPEDEDAHRRLGHVKLDGKWETADAAEKKRGYKFRIAYGDREQGDDGDYLKLEAWWPEAAAAGLAAALQQYLDSEQGSPGLFRKLGTKGFRKDDSRDVWIRETKLTEDKKKLRIDFHVLLCDAFKVVFDDLACRLDIEQAPDGVWRTELDLRSIFSPK